MGVPATLIEGAHAGIVGRLDAIEKGLEEAAKEANAGSGSV
jgi:hypothetical protein